MSLHRVPDSRECRLRHAIGFQEFAKAIAIAAVQVWQVSRKTGVFLNRGALCRRSEIDIPVNAVCRVYPDVAGDDYLVNLKPQATVQRHVEAVRTAVDVVQERLEHLIAECGCYQINLNRHRLKVSIAALAG